MPAAWLRHRSAFAFFLFFPWFPRLPLSPPEAEPPAVAVETGVAGKPQTAAPALEEPLVLPGVVIEEIPKGSALEKAGLQVGDVILSWERLPDPPANPKGASGKIESPFDWMWLEIEQPPRGRVVLSYIRNEHTAFAHVLEGFWGASVTPSLSESARKRLAELKSKLKDAKGMVTFASVKEDLELFRESMPPEIVSSEFLAFGDLYARFSRWEDAASAYQAALAGLDNSLFQTMVLSSQASLYRARNMVGEAIALFDKTSEHYRAAGAYVLLARERQRLARLYVTSNAYPKASKALDEAAEVLTLNCPGSLALASVLNSRGVLRRDLRDLSGARLDHEAALKISRSREPCGDQEASALSGLGNVLYIQGDLSEAENIYREMLAIRERTAPEGPFMANALANLANVYHRKGYNEQSLLLNEHALRIRVALAPDSLAVADSFNSIGLNYKDKGDLWVAESFLEEAIRIRSNLIPGSLAEAEAVSNLGLIALKREEYGRAISLFLRARQSLQPLQQGKPFLAAVLGNIGLAYFHWGDLVNAEKFLAESVEGLKRGAGSSSEIATALLNLGNVSYERADYEMAGERYREAKRLFKGSGKISRELSVCLANLAAIAQRMHRLDEAAALYKESLSIEEELAPRGPELARILANMGLISLDEGKFSEAESLEMRALSIARERGQPLGVAQVLTNLGEIASRERNYAKAIGYYYDSLGVLEGSQSGLRERAEVLFNLGWLYQKLGESGRAREFLFRALETSRKFAQGTWLEAEIQHALGELSERRGETSLSQELFRSAVSTIEKEAARFEPQPSDRQQFRVKYREFYGSLLRNLIAAGEVSEGFVVAEQSKGRSFLETLLIRGLKTEDDSASRSANRFDFGAIEARMLHITQALSTWAGEPAEAREREKNVEELLRLRQEYGDALRELEQGSPRVAALRAPKFLDVDSAVASLEPKMVLLSYWVSGERTFLFVLSRKGALRVHEVPIGQSSLSERIWRLRNLINAASSRTSAAELRNREAKRLGRELYQLLVFPVEDQIEAAERVQIAPDGPLHYLPFSALVREVSEGNGRLRDQYFSEWRPFHSVLSATSYEEVKRDRRPAERDALNLVAFGDPQFPKGMGDREPDSVSDFRLRSAVRRDAFSFAPLPFSRREVEGIAAVFPPGEAQIFVGADATEERAKAVGKTARILHFATHAHLDDRLPLDSALVLTIPEGLPADRDNGLLQVWEIFEKVRLNADLVVLSGCETALGEEQGGEGLIGLTRAFQYAGARTVMASLWSVRDQATSELMIRFYKHLRAGLPKDEALRQAQIELIRGPIEVVNEKGEKTLFDASAPYFWAGFQVYGDWQ